jgi:hypothetical protein
MCFTAHKAYTLPSSSKKCDASRCSEEVHLQTGDHGRWNNTWIHLSQLDSLEDTSAEALIAGTAEKSCDAHCHPVCTFLVESVAPSTSDIAMAQESVYSLDQTWTSIIGTVT